jgi:hypothetical protein
MRIPRSEHTRHPWRIHAIAPDFRLEDLWAYRPPGAGPDDFPAVLHAIRGKPDGGSSASRFLFALRWKLGALLGWDKPEHGLLGRSASLRDRLPDDLRQETPEPTGDSPFSLVYQLPDECALELANRTMHGVCHFGWVPIDGEYELRMAVLVKPNGRFGRQYMAAIKPFRYLIVYPAMARQWDRAWRQRSDAHDTSAPHRSDPPEATHA